VQPDEPRGVVRLHLHHALERDPARAAIARPVREQERRHARVAHRADVRAAVAEPDERARMHEHLAHGIEVHAGVVEDREYSALGFRKN